MKIRTCIDMNEEEKHIVEDFINTLHTMCDSHGSCKSCVFNFDDNISCPMDGPFNRIAEVLGLDLDRIR